VTLAVSSKSILDRVAVGIGRVGCWLTLKQKATKLVTSHDLQDSKNALETYYVLLLEQQHIGLLEQRRTGLDWRRSGPHEVKRTGRLDRRHIESQELKRTEQPLRAQRKQGPVYKFGGQRLQRQEPTREAGSNILNNKKSNSSGKLQIFELEIRAYE